MPDVFQPGNLIRIKNFEFEDRSTRDKYMFVLLRNETEAYVISTLTTSQNKWNLSATKRGCYHRTGIFTYFHFPANETLDMGGFFFDTSTYILFRDNIRKISLAELLNYFHPNDPLSVIRLATLENQALRQLLDCVLSSPFVPNNLKAELNAFRDSL